MGNEEDDWVFIEFFEFFTIEKILAVDFQKILKSISPDCATWHNMRFFNFFFLRLKIHPDQQTVGNPTVQINRSLEI